MQPAYSQPLPSTTAAARLGALIALVTACVGVRFALAAQPTTTPSVESVQFATAQPMPVARVAPDMQGLSAVVGQSVARLSEGAVLQAAVTAAPRPLRLTATQSASLRRGFHDVYAAMAADPSFARLSSVLPQAISQDAARPGHYFLYTPSRLVPGTRVIVFLHGFGGNFQFYLWLLKTAFPDDVIVCPSYGLAWTRQGASYLDEVLRDVERRVKIGKTKPWLMAISAGGPASFAIYNSAPSRFSGLVCLASCPQPSDVAATHGDVKILMINGAQDDRFRIENVRGAVARLRPRVRGLQFKELPDADHFFLLMMPDETFEAIRDFLITQR